MAADSFLLPMILGVTPPEQVESVDTVVLINPITALGFEIDGSRMGRRPASKAAIDALKEVEIESGDCDDSDQCSTCLDEWEGGSRAKKLGCGHRFHGECIEKWLRIDGRCPVCRYEMPAAAEEDDEKKNREILEIWLRFVGVISGENFLGGSI